MVIVFPLSPPLRFFSRPGKWLPTRDAFSVVKLPGDQGVRRGGWRGGGGGCTARLQR